MLHNERGCVRLVKWFGVRIRMKRIRHKFSLSVVVVSMVLGMVALAEAQKRDDKDIRDAVRILNSKVEDFETNLRYQMQSSSANASQLSEVSDHIRALRNKIIQFQDAYDRKRENRDDVKAIASATRRVDEFMRANPQNRVVEDDWAGVRKQVDRLCTNYGITNASYADQQETKGNSQIQTKTTNVGLSGTYDLDAARSENIEDIVADTKLGTEQRQDLKDKLTAPEQIAIDIRGTQVTLATTNAAPITFTADGRDKTEQSASGKTIKVRATLTGDNLIVSSLGGETDYTITFTSDSDGQVMKVSRRITTDYLNETVFAESIYNKTDAVAQLGIRTGSPTADPNNGGYSDNDNSGAVSNGSSTTTPTGRPSATTAKPGNYTVPNGVTITGTLDNELNTKVSQNNDRFRMTVQSPDEFRGATVEGYVSGISRSGAVTGASKLTLNFEKITLKNGQTYDFAGNLQSVQALDGKLMSIDNEGSVKGESQTKQTAKRGAIGAGIGAVIGAIAGGGKWAGLGAIIGAGGGAGTVAVQGKTDIQLQQGSTISVMSSSPLQ